MTLSVFKFTDQRVRMLLVDGEPWFVARDVCAVVGIAKHRDATAQLDSDERASMAVDTLGGMQQMTVVNEAGVYSLMLISRSPQVRDFKRWLTREVLPEIRRTGSYSGAVELPKSYAEALRAAADAWDEKEKAERALAMAAPKVEAFDAFMEADGCYAMEAAAKSLYEVTGLGRNKLYAWLRSERVLMSTNTPYQAYVNRDWFRVTVGSYMDSRGHEHPTHTTRVTPKGIAGIRAMWEGR